MFYQGSIRCKHNVRRHYFLKNEKCGVCLDENYFCFVTNAADYHPGSPTLSTAYGTPSTLFVIKYGPNSSVERMVEPCRVIKKYSYKFKTEETATIEWLKLDSVCFSFYNWTLKVFNGFSRCRELGIQPDISDISSLKLLGLDYKQLF